MELKEAEGIVASLSAERDAAEAEVAELARRIDSLVMILDGLYGLFPDLEPEPYDDPLEKGEPMTMGEAFMVVLESNPDQWFSIVELLDEIADRNIGPRATEPEAAGRAAFKRLINEKKAVRRKRSGRSYEYRLYSLGAAGEAKVSEMSHLKLSELADSPRPMSIAEDPA